MLLNFLVLVPARCLVALLLSMLLSPLACSTVGPCLLAKFETLSTAQPPSPNACNGDTALCDRRYDEIAYATTHNAMSASDRGFWNANQRGSLSKQLNDGIRALMLDTHSYSLRRGDNRPWLCHRFCLFGGQPLVDGLREIKDFLDKHPREVVTIILESHVDSASTQRAFEESGLLGYAHAQVPNQAWPTLREMVGTGRRLVVFSDHGGGAYPWYHDQFAWMFENTYEAWRDSDFKCAVNRGKANAGLFVFNHFISDPMPDRDAAARVNQGTPLWSHATRCLRERGRLPNFVTVDHYDVGDVLAVVKRLNRRSIAVAAVQNTPGAAEPKSPTAAAPMTSTAAVQLSSESAEQKTSMAKM